MMDLKNHTERLYSSLKNHLRLKTPNFKNREARKKKYDSYKKKECNLK